MYVGNNLNRTVAAVWDEQHQGDALLQAYRRIIRFEASLPGSISRAAPAVAAPVAAPDGPVPPPAVDAPADVGPVSPPAVDAPAGAAPVDITVGVVPGPAQRSNSSAQRAAAPCNGLSHLAPDAWRKKHK